MSCVLFGASLLVAGLLVCLSPLLVGWDRHRIQHRVDSGLVPQAIIFRLSAVFTIIILKWFLKRRGDTFKALGFGSLRLSAFWQAVAGFLVYFASYLVIISLTKALLPALDLEQQQDLGFSINGGASLPLLFLSLVIVPPLLEEVMMRGFLFSGLRTKLPFLAAALGTSALFAAAHLPEGKGGLLWVGAIDTFVLSVVLCFMRETTGSLWPGLFVHAI